ncbi:hypothetical protein [Butyricicoccus porcorum]|nr:hypothetical protein [Butyricicoccus porcorum]
MGKIIIAIIIAVLVIDVLIVYSCCVVSGRADRAAISLWEDKYGQK